MAIAERTQESNLRRLRSLHEEHKKIWNGVMNCVDPQKRRELRVEYQATANRIREVCKQFGNEFGFDLLENEKLLFEKPNLFRYHDYRLFLSDHIAYLNDEKKITQEQMAKKLGVYKGYFKQIVEDARPMTKKALHELMIHLELSETEMKFLEQLRIVSDVISTHEKAKALKEIQKFPGYVKANPKEHEAWKYLSQWYIVAIRELAALKDFRLDPVWIQSRLRGNLTVDHINQALEFLIDTKLLVPDGSGGAKPADKDIDCSASVFAVAIGHFHLQQLAMAAKSIGEIPRTHRFITGRSACLNRAQYEKVCEILADTIGKLQDVGEGSEAEDEVYHLGLFAAPLTQHPEPPEGQS